MKSLPAVFISLCGLALCADLNRGVDLYNQGKYAEAESELKGVVQEEPENSRAHQYLGLALLEQKKVADAASHVAKADELAPSGDTKLALARLYVEQKENDKAEAALREASGEDLPYVRGLLHFHGKRNEEAAQNLEEFLKAKPDHAYAHYYAGMAYSSLKKPDKMLSHFEMFVKLKPDAPEARKVRAVLQTGR